MALYETDSYRYTSVAADFGAHEQKIIQPEGGYIYGPYQPLTEEQIADLEANAFGAMLTDYEKIVLEGVNQYTLRAEAYRSVGEGEIADEFESQATRIFENIKKATAQPHPERIRPGA
jgi:hypothetical protein